ncbi:hypothetical protein XHV734_4430 [Xanthomonas hortorum pv. vitians]|nr:hypothetical protein XHV734_4430 [Xanthomonas hortorum pv. vitians]
MRGGAGEPCGQEGRVSEVMWGVGVSIEGEERGAAQALASNVITYHFNRRASLSCPSALHRPPRFPSATSTWPTAAAPCCRG